MIRRFVKCISTAVTLIVMVCCLHSPSKAQIGTTHFCDVNIDTVTDSLIQNALLYGTAQEVTNLIDTGKKQIDTAVGCGKAGYAYFPTPYDTPTFILIINDWYQFHAFNHLSQIATSCPGTGRVEGSMALGGFFARLAGLYVNLDTLNYPPLNAIQEQYDSTHVTPPLLYPSGVYGYYNMAAPNPCNIIGLTDNDISNHYVNPTSYAVIYNNGAYAGDSLVVRDYD